jgi:brefeldin A-inhibited guanine nucleotide-exchange protein
VQGDDKGGFFGTNQDRRKKEEFSKERESMVRASEQMFKRRQLTKRGASKEQQHYHKMTDMKQEHVSPMFAVAWAPMLAVFSVTLETTEEEKVIGMCLDGFSSAVRISASFRMDVVRDAFVTSLAKFTTLDTVREMQPKNIECIKTLIALALTDGNFLQASWAQVLDCISQLARLQLISQGLQTDEEFFPTQSTGGRAECICML